MLLLAAAVVLGAVEVEALADAPLIDRPDAPGPGAVAHRELRNGLPTFIWAEAAPAVQGLTSEQAARRHLWSYASRYRTSSAELAAAPLAALHDTGEGAVIATFRRGTVFRETLTVVMDRELNAVALTGYLSPGPVPEHRARLTVATAFSIAVQHATGRWESVDAEPTEQRAGWTWYGDRRARPTLYALPNRFEPAWDLELDISGEPCRAVVSAHDGRVLHFSSQREAASAYRVFADGAAPFTPWEGPTGTAALPHPAGVPDNFNPQYVTPVLVTLDNAGLATSDPWLPAGATTLHGNNAVAYADRSAPDGLYTADGGATSDVETSVSAPGAFDWSYALQLEPDARDAGQRQASSTHAFFVVNWLHDTYYSLGFDERAGNAQESNFGRGGDERDALLVEVQDYRGINGAAMNTPADGKKPRLELFPFTDESPAFLTVNALDAGWVVGTSFGPTTYDVAGSLILGRSADGGTDGCRGPFLNSGATSGNVVLLAYHGGRCSAQNQMENATDAGATGVVLQASGNSITNFTGLITTAKPSVNMRQSDAAPLISILGSGGTLDGRLRRVQLPDRDSALDTTIVAHEWTHYLSNRLVGDGVGLSTTIGWGLGEGWGDFNALLVLIQPSDAAVASNAMWKGTWSIAGFSLAPPSLPAGIWYYGIRRFPYSIDRTKNDLTFRHVQDGEQLPATPGQTAAGGANSQGHNAGEIWATALLEGYAALLTDTARLTFAEAQRRMRGYLVASLKATPPNPTWLEARDAWLAVAQARDPADRLALSQAFARRGFGPGATGPDRFATDNRTVVEDFTATATRARIESVTVDDAAPRSCDYDGVLDNTERGEVVVRLFNSGTTDLAASTGTVTSSTAGITFPNGAALSFPAAAPYTTVTARTAIAYTGARGPLPLDLAVTVTNAMLPASLSATAALPLDSDVIASDTETFETGASDWALVLEWAGTRIGAEQGFQLVEQAGNTFARGPTPDVAAATYFVSPTLEVGTTAPLHLHFNHRWQLRAGGADGALLTVSPDDGVTWMKMPGAAMTPAYNGTLVNGGQNPLRGMNAPAWTGSSPMYPMMQPQDVDLGMTYAGKKVRFSLAVGVDQGSTGAGWDVDDIRVTGLAAGRDRPFLARRADDDVCVNGPPVARAGADVFVDERAMVHLDGSASTDPDGQTLTLTWRQVGGPPVTLTSGDFTAPEVTGDTLLTFELTASDGALMSTDDVVVTVRNVNRAPTVTASGPARASANSDVTLTAMGSDPDGDSLTYAWTQSAGTPVMLSGQASVTFIAPSGGGTLAFSVTASDGPATSAPATVEVVLGEPPGGGGGGGGGCKCGSSPGVLLLGALAALVTRSARSRRRHEPTARARPS